MPLLLLICLMLACVPIPWPAPPFNLSAGESALATAGVVMLFLAATGLLVRRTLGSLARFPDRRDLTLQRYTAWRILHFFLLLGVFGTALYSLGWGWSVRQSIVVHAATGELTMAPGGEFIILLPFFVMQLGSWFLFYRVSYTLHASGIAQSEPFWTRWGYVLFHLRQNVVLVYAPLILFLVPQGLLRVFPSWQDSPWVEWGSLLLVPMFLLLMPLAMRPLLGLRALPDGALRERLQAHARRLGFRYRNIMLWDTRRGIATAMVVGLIPQVRYVIFTDRLLTDLRDDEVDAVFGHELGHVKHGHMLFYALFLILSLLLLKSLYQVMDYLGWLTATGSHLMMLSPVLFIGSYMFLVFGFLSRRCERQADLFGCRAGSCTNADCNGHDATTVLAPRGRGLCRSGIGSFIRALERVEVVNDMHREPAPWRNATLRERVAMVFRFLTGWLSSWQHSTISKRIEFLRRVAIDGNVERRFQRRVAIVKWAVILGLAGALLAIGAIFNWDFLRPGA